MVILAGEMQRHAVGCQAGGGGALAAGDQPILALHASIGGRAKLGEMGVMAGIGDLPGQAREVRGVHHAVQLRDHHLRRAGRQVEQKIGVIFQLIALIGTAGCGKLIGDGDIAVGQDERGGIGGGR